MLLFESTFFALFHVALGQYQYEEPLLYDTFPDGFAWGVATSAYQVISLKNTLKVQKVRMACLDRRRLERRWKGDEYLGQIH